MDQERLRIHVLGQAHVPLHENDVNDPWIARKWSAWIKLLRNDIDIVYYGVETTDVQGIDIVNVVPYAIYAADIDQVTSGSRTRDGYYTLPQEAKLTWSSMWSRGLSAVAEHLTPNDIIVAASPLHKQTFRGVITPFRSHFRNIPVVEAAIDYYRPFTRFRVYNSYAVKHYACGLENNAFLIGYDSVAYCPINFQTLPLCTDRKDYLLYDGKITNRTGIELAAKIAEVTDLELIVTGYKLEDYVDPLIRRIVEQDHVTFVGYPPYEKRMLLIQQARALIQLPSYIEPYDHTCMEALACGTPVIAPASGFYSEVVVNNVNGFLIRNLDEGVSAIEKLGNIQPESCRSTSINLCNPDKIRDHYICVFRELLTRVQRRRYDPVKVVE